MRKNENNTGKGNGRHGKKHDVMRFALKCLLIPAAAILILYCLNKPYRKISDQKYLDVAKFTMLGAQYPEVHIGNLGSSHGAYDFVYTPFSERGYFCFNFANTSQSYDYDYAIMKEYGHYMTRGSVLFIPVSYFSFNNEVVNDTEAEAMSLRYYHCLSPQNIPSYDPYIDIITNRLPILSAGEDIMQLFPKLQTVLTAHAAESGVNVEEFARRAGERYSRHFDNKEEYFMPERIEQLYDIIYFCKEREITPILITTPFSGYYYDLVSPEFLQKFNETVMKISTDTTVKYYDYSNDPRFRDNLELFSDADHLNKQGAAYFMQVLIEEVPELTERFP